MNEETSEDQLLREISENSNPYSSECPNRHLWSEGFRAGRFGMAQKTQNNELVIPPVSQLVCMCHNTIQVTRINDKYICCTCNRPII